LERLLLEANRLSEILAKRAPWADFAEMRESGARGLLV
jgi:hypothetical protein